MRDLGRRTGDANDIALYSDVQSSAGAFEMPFENTNSVQVPHNLGYFPQVSIVVDGEDIEGIDVEHIDNDLLTVNWNGSLTGKVVCS